MEWIKTSDRLPEPWITVLVAGGIAYHNPEANTWHSRTGNDTGKIIEWPVNDWAVLPSPYDLPEEIDITKTMYPSDMMQYDSPPFAGTLPPTPTNTTAQAMVRCMASLIRALSVFYRDSDGGDAELQKIVRVLEGDAHDMGIL